MAKDFDLASMDRRIGTVGLWRRTVDTFVDEIVVVAVAVVRQTSIRCMSVVAVVEEASFVGIDMLLVRNPDVDDVEWPIVEASRFVPALGFPYPRGKGLSVTSGEDPFVVVGGIAVTWYTCVGGNKIVLVQMCWEGRILVEL